MSFISSKTAHRVGTEYVRTGKAKSYKVRMVKIHNPDRTVDYSFKVLLNA